MNCPNCNAPLADGTTMCPTCGMPVAQQPNMQYQQPNMQYQQPNMQYQQPNPNMQYQQPDPNQFQQPNPNQFQQAQNYGVPAGQMGFVDTIKSNPLKICDIVAIFFLFLVAWMPSWVSAFGMGAGLLASDGGILKLWALFFVLVAAWTSIVLFGSNIRALKGVVEGYKRLPFSQFYIPAFVILLFILVICNSMLRTTVKYGASWGLCFYLCIIAIILLLVRPVMCIVKKQEYWV